MRISERSKGQVEIPHSMLRHGVTISVMPKIPDYYTKHAIKWVTQYNPHLGGKIHSSICRQILPVATQAHSDFLSCHVKCDASEVADNIHTLSEKATRNRDK